MSATNELPVPASFALPIADIAVTAPARAFSRARRGFVAAVEFAEAYAIIEMSVVLVVASFSSILLAQALGFHLVE